MIKYDVTFINNIINNMKNENLLIIDSDTQNYLNNILNTLKKNNKKYNNFYNHNNSNNSNNSSYNNKHNIKSKYNRDNRDNRDNKDNKDNKFEEKFNNSDNYNIYRIKLQNNKSDSEIHINFIRKLLNKLSNNNFEKINNELICYYNTILKDENIETINNFIFNNLTLNNSIFSELYCKLYYNLLSINEKFIDLLNNNIIVFLNISEKLYLINNTDIETVNKNNDKYICFVSFYINCFKLKLLPEDILYNCITNIQAFLNSQLKIENNKFSCEILTNFIFTIISNSYELLIDENYFDIFENIKYINNMKNGDLPSLNNKIIFKHRDIFEKYKPHENKK